MSGSDESFYGDEGAEGANDDDHREGEPRTKGGGAQRSASWFVSVTP